MTEFSTLSDMLLARRDSKHDLVLVNGENDQRTLPFASLADRALACLKALQDKGLRPGDELVVFSDDNEEFLVAFWGAILGGIVPVPVAVGISDEHRLKLLRILRQLDNPMLFSNARLIERLRAFADANGHDDVQPLLDKLTLTQADIGDGAGELHEARPEDRAFIQYSSGSTSAPKGICLTHANLVSNVTASIQALKLTEKDRAFSWMPLTHDMGLIGYHVIMLSANVGHGIMDTALFVKRPLMWLQKVTELGSTILCSPNFGYKHYLKVCERKGPGDIDLSHVRLILNGAEPISVDLCNEFLDAMQPHGLAREAMYPVYGLAEATLAVTMPEQGREFTYVTVDRHRLRIGEPYSEVAAGSDDAFNLVRLGMLIDGVDMRIADDDDQPLPQGHIGHILLRGPNVTAGIYGDPDDEADIFTADGWLRTGDCGAISEGQLIITGRQKEIIIVNGQNYAPHDIEEAVATLDDLDIGKVVACGAASPGSKGEELLVFVLYRKDLESFVDLAHDVRMAVGARIGLQVDHVLPVARIPKTTSGKLQRRALAEAYLDGEYADIVAQLDRLTVVHPDENEADPLVRELEMICAEFSKDKVVGPDDNLFEVGISSLTLTEIMLAIDEKYPGKVDINDLFEYPTIRSLAGFLRRDEA